MIPFRLDFQPGQSLYEQVVYAAKKAVVSGQLRPGDAFPSVRELSRELKINPNTAHKVVLQLVQDGVLQVQSGVGTVVAARAGTDSVGRARVLEQQMEALVVEAKRLGLSRDKVAAALEEHWARLEPAHRSSR